MSSGTSSISATIAKLCSSSSMLSSVIAKNVDTANDLLLAGIMMLVVALLKSGGSEMIIKKCVYSLYCHCYTLVIEHVSEPISEHIIYA